MGTTRRTRLIFVAAAWLAACLPSLAFAQHAATGAGSRWAGLQEGDRLRVVFLPERGAPGGPATIEGRFAGFRGDQLVLLDRQKGESLLPLARVGTVERRHGPGRGIAIGAFAGGLLGGALGFVAESGDEQDGFFDPTSGQAALGVGLLGAAAGTLFGALTGSGWDDVTTPPATAPAGAASVGVRLRFRPIFVRRGGGIGVVIVF